MTNDISGKIIRGYHMGDIIGSGGFGVVYKAHQPIIERDVAIKIIHAKYANQLDFTRRFELEARLIARLESQYIVPIYDFWRDSTGAYMVMRWLRGNNLRSLLNQTPRPSIEVVARILFQLVSALTVAHQQNVVHRDIKPENVLFDEHQNVYLTDFGIAVDIMHMPNEITLKALSLGSPMYMAPEQLTRQATSPQADVYSLGILLYEMLAGKAPFSGGVTEIIQQKRMSLPIASLLTIRQDLPPALDGVLWQATAQSPIARYNSVVDLFNAFIKVVSVKGDFSMLGWLSSNQKMSPSQFVSKSDTLQLDGGGTLILNQPPQPSPPPSAVEWIQNDTYPLHTLIRNPFKGLRPFDELDARDFFGRKEAISRLSDFFADHQNRFLAVVGPSGSGKSSLVRAGLLAMVRQQTIPQSQNWVIATMTPSDDPFTALREALAQVTMTNTLADLSDLRDAPQVLQHYLNQILPKDIELFLFIDQFEEIFTQNTDEPIAHDFLEMLHHSLTHPQSRLRLILTLRADYYDRPLQHQHFGELIREHTEVVLPLSDLALEEIIIEPSLQVGLAVQPDLKMAILHDLSGQQGALPLLQYTLSELYENRNGSNLLSLATYRALGGISGALSRRAEAIFADLTASEQATAQQLFLRCVTVEGGGVPTRKRALMTALLANLSPEGRDRLVAVTEKFTRWRLLTLDRDPATRSPTIDIAHEALIGAWSRLAGWIEDNRANLRRYYQLQMLTQAWHESGKDNSFLAVGVRLSEFEDLLTTPFITLSPDENTFIASSMALKRRKENRSRLGVIGLAAVAIFMTILAIFAVAQGQLALQAQAQALIERDRANTTAQIARSRELAANSLSVLNRVDVALLLGYYATTIADTVEARNSLLTALQVAPNISTYLHGHAGDVRTVIYSPDATQAITAGADRIIRVWDTASWELSTQLLTIHADAITALVLVNDTLFSAGADGAIFAWDMTTFTPQSLSFPIQNSPIWALAGHPDASIFVSGAEDGTLTVWDATTGRIIRQIESAHAGAVYALAFSPDGSILASGGGDNRVRFWDMTTGESLADTPASHTNWVSALAFSPTGKQLASSGADSTLILWDMATLSPAQTVTLDDDVWVRGITYNTTGEMVALAGLDGRLRIWDAVGGQFLGNSYAGHLAGIWDVAPSPSGDGFITSGADGLVIVWDFTPPYRMATRAFVIGRDVMSMALHPSGETLMIGANNGLVQAWDVDAGQVQTRLNGHDVAVTAMNYSPTGDYLATFDLENTLIIWRVSDMSIIYQTTISGAVITPNIAFSADEASVFVAGEGELLRVGIVDGQTTAISTAINAIVAFEVSADGDLLAVGGSSGDIELLSLADDAIPSMILRGHTDAITALRFARGRGVLVSASRDNLLIVWDMQTRQPLYEPLRAHTDWVLDVAIAPDERLMASVGRDQTVILWDMTTARPLGLPFVGHRGWAQRVRFSTDGTRVYSAGADGVIFEWMVGLGDWQRLACQISNRAFYDDEWGRYFDSEPPAPCGD